MSMHFICVDEMILCVDALWMANVCFMLIYDS